VSTGAPTDCAAYCSSHSRKAAFKVVPRDRATSLARSIRVSSALREMFFIATMHVIRVRWRILAFKSVRIPPKR